MCGIAGFYISPAERYDTARLVRELHESIDYRGGDATGAAWMTDTGEVRHLTSIGRAARFRSMAPNAGNDARLAILHTRYATQGSPKNQVNNHPIRTGTIFGVHNGHISNDDELFAEIPFARRGEVDSEAAFAVIRHAKMTGTDIAPSLERLRGGAALAWFDSKTPDVLHLARASSSPLAIAQTQAGSVFFASTPQDLWWVLTTLNIEPEFYVEPDEGTYFRFEGGVLAEVARFTPRRYWSKHLESALGKTSAPKTKAEVKTEARAQAATFQSWDDEEVRWAEEYRAWKQGKTDDMPVTPGSGTIIGKYGSEYRGSFDRSRTVPRRPGDSLVPYSSDVYDLADARANKKRRIHDVPLSEDGPYGAGEPDPWSDYDDVWEYNSEHGIYMSRSEGTWPTVDPLDPQEALDAMTLSEYIEASMVGEA